MYRVVSIKLSNTTKSKHEENPYSLIRQYEKLDFVTKHLIVSLRNLTSKYNWQLFCGPKFVDICHRMFKKC